MVEISVLKEALKIRAFEQNLLNSYSQGYLNGTVHTCIGQEIVPVLIAKNIKNLKKLVVSNHRGHGHYLSLYPDKVNELLLEVMGKIGGVSGGYGGSQHLFGKEFLSNGIQGGMIPTLAGAIYAMRKRENNVIGVGYIGDGTLGQGVLYEALNFIGILSLPILIVLDDNGYAQSTKTENWLGNTLSNRFEGFNFKYSTLDMRDFDGDLNDVDLSIQTIISDVLDGQPTVLHVKSNRLKPHSKGDDNRPDSFLERIERRDYLNKILKEDLTLQTFYEETLKELASTTEDFSKENDFTYFKVSPKSSLHLHEQKRYTGTFNSLINAALDSILASNSSAIIIGEDIRDISNNGEKVYGGAFKVTKGLSSQYNDQVLNSPISEQMIIGFALGHSLRSAGSIAEIMFGDFLTLGLDQLLQHAAKFKTMYGQNIDIPLIVRTPMGGKRGYGPTHSQSIEKHFIGIDGLNVYALNHRVDPITFYAKILQTKCPTLIIENKILYTLKYQPLPDFYSISIWEDDYFIIETSESADISIFCYGENLNVAEKVADTLLDEEIYIRIICANNLNSNLDSIAWGSFENHHIITIEEGSTIASWSSIVSEQLTQNKVHLKAFTKYGNNQTIPSNLQGELNLLPNVKTISKEIINSND
jgi:2-oxoisovalerate dehydrogenase E1 component